ncbi:ATP-dependent DNA helicase [Salmonella phage SEA1]|nr:ATP-dependent DNA helicase [Salmonella phage SEA1]
MSDIQVNFHDFSHVRIDCEESVFHELRDFFSFEADGYKFNPRYRYGNWDGRIRLLDYNRLLPFGLVGQIKKFCDNFGYKFWIDPKIFEKEDLSRNDFDEWLGKLQIYSGNTKIEPHWYQKDAVYEGIVNRRRILNLPTSAGKSLIQCLLSRYYVEKYEGKILIIVPTTALVDQMINDFCDYRLFGKQHMLGIRSGTRRDSDAMIYVATWQTAIKQPKEWFSQFGLMMNDECFDGDTLIKTPNGDVKIKDIKPGDKIYSYNEDTKEVFEDEVVKLHKNLTKSSSEKMYELEMDDGTIIKVTGNHKFLTNRGWVRADELTENDDIVEWK